MVGATDFAQGLPASAQQIVWWLREEGMANIADMDASGILGLRTGRTAASGVPKTLQSMVLLRIDQLPAGLVLVLRTASVLGFSFDTVILRKVLEAQGTQTSGLTQQLATLREFQFIAPVDRTAATSVGSFTSSPYKGETWQVRVSVLLCHCVIYRACRAELAFNAGSERRCVLPVNSSCRPYISKPCTKPYPTAAGTSCTSSSLTRLRMRWSSSPSAPPSSRATRGGRRTCST